MRTRANIDSITSNDIVIVANNRQVLALTQQYSLERGTCWLPTISTIQNLLISNYQKECISEMKMLLIFKECLSSLSVSFNTQTIRDLLREYKYYRQYAILKDAINPTTSFHTLFIKFLDVYEKYKQTHTCKDVFDIYTSYTSSKQHYYFGFKAMNTLDAEFVSKVNALPLIIKEIDATIHTSVYESDILEIEHICKQAYNLHQQDSSKNIAIIHPKLEEYCALFRHHLSELYSQHCTLTADKAFNISLGRPLISYALCKDFFMLLEIYAQLATNQCSSEKLQMLVRSSYCDMGNELSIAIGNLNTTVTINELSNIEEFNAIVTALKHNKIFLDETYTCSQAQWMDIFDKLCTSFHFLTNAHLCSDEYQLLQKLKQELSYFYSSDKLSSPTMMLSDIYTILSTVLFSAKSGSDQLQIMGSLEAEGLLFDVVWIAGLSADTIPQSLQTLSFIPLEVCSKYNVPRTKIDEILDTAEKNIAIYQSIAPQIYMSSPRLKQEKEVFPSLFIEWEEECINTSYNEYAPSITNTRTLDVDAPSYHQSYLPSIISILKKQKYCPFSAFATRLGIDDNENDEVGISAKLRGILTHKALEYIYTQITSKKELDALCDSSLQRVITVNMERAFEYIQNQEHISPKIDESLEIVYQLEFEQMLELLTHFLKEEQKRISFKVIAVEKKHTITIKEISSNIRIDRIDVDEEGRTILFDYKTNTNKIPLKNVQVDLTEPQLALYGIFCDYDVLGFIEIPSVKDLGYKYITSSSDEYRPKSSPFTSYNEQYTCWKEQIEKRIDDFTTGVATITPSNLACQYCDLSSLCRKNG